MNKGNYSDYEDNMDDNNFEEEYLEDEVIDKSKNQPKKDFWEPTPTQNKTKGTDK